MTASSKLEKFVGVIPYSLYENEPVALICKHNYTSTETRADADLYSELIIKKMEEHETSAQAISRVLSKISHGTFIKTKSTKNDRTADIKRCYNKMLSSINKFKNVAILENNNGYKLYLVPVKYIKTKKLHTMVKNNNFYNMYYKELHWISFNKLFSVIYEANIQKMLVNNIENYKLKTHKPRKLTDYKPCRLSLQFCSVLRNAHFRVIIPFFDELKFSLNDEVRNPEIQQIKTQISDTLDDIDSDGNKKMETFIVRCKKCRVKLFTDLQISVHTLNTLNDECKSNCIFLDSSNNKVIQLLEKMTDCTQIKGLLSCFKCGQKLGRFNYCGQECPCTYYICPAFQVSVSKVDVHQIQKKEIKKMDSLDVHLPMAQFRQQDYSDILGVSDEKTNGINSVHIVHVSDTHELYEQFTKHIPFKENALNILVHSGDFSPEDGPIKRRLKEFGKWFRELPHQKKIIIAGNHEGAITGLSKAEIMREVFDNDERVIYLQDESVNLWGINIYGTPWNETCMAFGADEKEMKEKWEMVPDCTDILVTHQPPYDDEILCKVTSGGCTHLWNEIVGRIKPKVHLFGHFHGYNGYVKCKDVLFINSSLKPPTEREIPCVPHQFDVIFDL